MDKLIVYRIVNELRSFYRDYSINIGGGSLPPELQARYRQPENTNLVNKLRAMDKQISGNFEALNKDYLDSYNAIS